MTRKTAFFEGWSWFKFNNLGLALDMNLKFYTSEAKGLKLKVRMFYGLVPTFVEVTGEKVAGDPLLPTLPPILNRVNVRSSEHLDISHLTGKRAESKKSAVSDHLLLHNHDRDFNDSTILCRDNNVFKLLLKEFILVSRDSSVLDKNTTSIPLSLFD